MKSLSHYPYISFRTSWRNVQFIRRLGYLVFGFFFCFFLACSLSDIDIVKSVRYEVWWPYKPWLGWGHCVVFYLLLSSHMTV